MFLLIFFKHAEYFVGMNMRYTSSLLKDQNQSLGYQCFQSIIFLNAKVWESNE